MNFSELFNSLRSSVRPLVRFVRIKFRHFLSEFLKEEEETETREEPIRMYINVIGRSRTDVQKILNRRKWYPIEEEPEQPEEFSVPLEMTEPDEPFNSFEELEKREREQSVYERESTNEQVKKEQARMNDLFAELQTKLSD